ncbi:MAG: DUF2752 domain-containing protein [Muribaculaceae bacterium]|nr:DUF2752 domain-containing protein [Muribaculaceae bacterium]
MTHALKKALAAAAIVAVAALCVYYYKWEPGAWPAPRCTLRMLTGYDCPGCGSQRAFHALLHGRVAEAWGFNAGVFFAIPLAVCYFAVDRMPRRVSAVLQHPVFIIGIALAIVAWWVGRNI